MENSWIAYAVLYALGWLPSFWLIARWNALQSYWHDDKAGLLAAGLTCFWPVIIFGVTLYYIIEFVGITLEKICRPFGRLYEWCCSFPTQIKLTRFDDQE